MKAIEFISNKKKGDIIEIPKEYADEISGDFRVILILQEKPQKPTAAKREFKALKVKTKGFKFNRDDIYD